MVCSKLQICCSTFGVNNVVDWVGDHSYVLVHCPHCCEAKERGLYSAFSLSGSTTFMASVAVSNSLEGSLLVTVYSCDDCSEKLAISEAGILKSSRTRMPPKKMMQGWRVYATLMLYVVPLFESPMNDDV